MISGTSFPVGILLLGFFESLRDHVFRLLPAGFMQSLLLTHMKMHLLLVSGWFTKDSAQKSTTAASSFYC